VHWQPPQPFVCTKDLFPVLERTDVELAFSTFLSFKVLNRSVIVIHKLHVEFDEVGQGEEHQCCKEVRKTNNWVSPSQQAKIVDDRLSSPVQDRAGAYDDNHETQVCVTQELHEELTIVKSNAVVDPWAVVIHVEDAAIADATVVRPVRLPDVAHFAVSPPLGFISHVETPIRGNYARVRHDTLVESKQQVEEKDVVNYQDHYSSEARQVRAPNKEDKGEVDVEDQAQDYDNESHAIDSLCGERP